MKNKFTLLLFFLSINLFGQINSNPIEIGERFQVTSDFLEEDREFQVYLPPTYFFNTQNKFPVIYLIDGDYNFHYTTGVVEFLSNVSGVIPECIVVGIGDKGIAKYRANCTPNTVKGKGDKNGNANNHMSFISDELMPYINENFRAADYNIIIGQSAGGLFVTNFLIERPNTFDVYIAIDPALWVGDYEIVKRSDSLLKDRKALNALYYFSSSTMKDMGIDEFQEVLENHVTQNQSWKHLKFDNENHNAVGLPTLKESFEDIFKNWDLTGDEFRSFKSANEVIEYYKVLSNKFSFPVSIPPYLLGNMIYYYYKRTQEADLLILEEGIKQHFPNSIDDYYIQLGLNHFEHKKYEEAIAAYNKSIENNSLSFNAYDGISKVYLAQSKFDDALKACKKSIELAKSCNARLWMMNQLIAHLQDIKDQSGK